MKKIMKIRFDSPEWKKVDTENSCQCFTELGFKTVGDVMGIRMFDLFNLNRVNNNRAEELLICFYRLLYPNRKIDEGIYNDEIDQYFAYREWKKAHKHFEEVTVSDVLLTEGLNAEAFYHIFDKVTTAFYKSSEYDSRHYRYMSFKELLKYRIKCGKEDGNGKTH